MILTIHIARKPVAGSVAQNTLKWATGGINVDASRIATGENLSGGAYAKEGQDRHDGAENWRYKREGGAGDFQQPIGRWPANLILSHLPECEPQGIKTVQGNRTDTRPDGDGGREDKTQWRFRPTEATKRGYGAEEIITDWDCQPGCPVKEFPLAVSHGGGTSSTGFWQRDGRQQPIKKGDKGAASRYFKQIQEETPE